jgi:hypothetical protein
MKVIKFLFLLFSYFILGRRTLATMKIFILVGFLGMLLGFSIRKVLIKSIF